MDLNAGYTVRKAEKKDCKIMVAMIRGLAEEDNMTEQFLMTPEILERDGFELDPPCFSSLVAETKEKEVIAYSVFVTQYSTWNGKIMYMEDVFVKPEHRKNGVATMLIKKVNELSVEAGCQQLRLACFDWNTNAMKLYKKLGARDLTVEENWHMLRFDKEIMEKMYAK